MFVQLHLPVFFSELVGDSLRTCICSFPGSLSILFLNLALKTRIALPSVSTLHIDSESNLSGDTFSIEASQNLLRIKRIWHSKNMSSGKEFPFKWQQTS